MPVKSQRKDNEPERAAAKKIPKLRGKGWDERIRLVGDARFVEVQWSGRDEPSWPLPKK